jgi:hypothetical protein
MVFKKEIDIILADAAAIAFDMPEGAHLMAVIPV